MLVRIAMLAILAAHWGAAEILDRIAVTLDNRVIAESDLVREIRLSAFLNGTQPDLSGAAKRAAAARLVERTLMRREMELSRYPIPAAKDADAALANWRKEHFPGDEAFAKALRDATITQGALRGYLLEQLTALRFIDYRFKPGVQVLDSEVKQYYEKRLLPQSRSSGVAKDPPLEEVAEKIGQVLAEEKVDHMLDEWLKDARSRTRIVYREAVFQ